MLTEIDADAASRIHPNNLKKTIRAPEAAENGKKIPDFKESFVKNKDYEAVLIGLTRERQELYDRINQRVDQLLKQALQKKYSTCLIWDLLKIIFL